MIQHMVNVVSIEVSINANNAWYVDLGASLGMVQQDGMCKGRRFC